MNDVINQAADDMNKGSAKPADDSAAAGSDEAAA